MKALYLTCGLIFVSLCTAQDNTRTQVDDKKALITKVYRVPQKFVENIVRFSPPPEDATPHQTEREKGPDTIQEHLTNSGLTFIGGAKATYAPKSSLLTVTNTAEQLKYTEAFLDGERSHGPKRILIYMEFIEVEQEIFGDWLFENLLDSDGTKLRNAAQKWIKTGKGEIIDSVTAFARPGARVMTESAMEFIYPEQHLNVRSPSKVILKNGATSPMLPVTPYRFDTRKLGIKFTGSPLIGADDETIKLSLWLETVALERIKQWHHKVKDPRFKADMPTFYKQALHTEITLRDGRYGFLGTFRPLKPSDPARKNPIVLQFIRCDISSTNGWEVVK